MADEDQALVDLIAANPKSGNIMPACGGAGTLRVAVNPAGIGS
ncbi:hypothetical protein [Sphingomonas sp. Leaf17]|nr:hypothetical protein [Sphingomonas sp. Leaf17]